MLPEQLSSNLCSLHPGVDKLTYSMVWQFRKLKNHKYDVENPIYFNFSPGIIHSKARLSYEEADSIIEQNSSMTHLDNRWVTPEIESAVRSMNDLSRQIGSLRNPFDLDLEFSNQYKLDENNKIQIADTGTTASHKLIENLMILANNYAAKNLKDKDIIRTHTGLKGNNESFLKFLCTVYRLDTGRISGLYRSGKYRSVIEAFLQKINEDDKNIDFLRVHFGSMLSSAYYDKKDGMNPEAQKHIGVDLDQYTHFTSPIRRYADILVHLALKDKRIANFNSVDNDRVFLAKRLERLYKKIFALLYLVQEYPEGFRDKVLKIIKRLRVSSKRLYLQLGT